MPQVLCPQLAVSTCTVRATRTPRGTRLAPARAVRASVPDATDAVVIVGAGLAGLCAAAALNKVNIPTIVLEQRGEMSQEGAAIGLWGNAMKALDAIGVLILPICTF